MGIVTLRRLQARDLAAALQLTQAERWPHTLEDWEFHYRLGLGWAACNAEGKLLGTASWWAYGDEFATVGLILVDRECQGQGIGRQLMDTVMHEAAPRALQLVATEAGLKLYQRSGFHEQRRIGQHQGIAAEIPAASQLPTETVLRGVSYADLDALCDLDCAAFGVPRRQLIGAVFDRGKGVLALHDGRLMGFALARQAGRGTVIGPVVARDEALATALIAHQLKACSGFARVDIPTDAVHLAKWLEGAGLKCVDRVTVMVRGEAPKKSEDARVFALVSQALS